MRRRGRGDGAALNQAHPVSLHSTSHVRKLPRPSAVAAMLRAAGALDPVAPFGRGAGALPRKT